MVFWLSDFWERSLSAICLTTNFQTGINSANKLKLIEVFMSLTPFPADLQSPTICYCSAERKQCLYFLKKHLHHHRWPEDNRKTAIFIAFPIYAVWLFASLWKRYYRNGLKTSLASELQIAQEVVPIPNCQTCLCIQPHHDTVKTDILQKIPI